MDKVRCEKRVIPDRELFGRVKSSIEARFVDISSRGAQIAISTSLRPDASCDIWIPSDNGERRIRARVRWCQARAMPSPSGKGSRLVYCAGLEFSEPTLVRGGSSLLMTSGSQES